MNTQANRLESPLGSRHASPVMRLNSAALASRRGSQKPSSPSATADWSLQSGRLRQRNAKSAERGWNPRFSVAFSKDNDLRHRLDREYFDNRKIVDFDEVPKTLQFPQGSHLPRRRKVVRPRPSLQLQAWQPVYFPNSELNTARHSAFRVLFKNFRRARVSV